MEEEAEEDLAGRWAIVVVDDVDFARRAELLKSFVRAPPGEV